MHRTKNYFDWNIINNNNASGNLFSVTFDFDDTVFNDWIKLRRLFLETSNDSRIKSKVFRMVEKSFQSDVVLDNLKRVMISRPFKRAVRNKIEL